MSQTTKQQAKAAKAEFKAAQKALETPKVETTKVETPEETIARLQAENEQLRNRPISTRQPKGVLVEFTNQKGDKIRGFGQRYFVVRMNGKLYYKQEDSVTIL